MSLPPTRIRQLALACLLLCWPASLLAQPAESTRREADTPAWTMTGVDVIAGDRWRGAMRVGYLSELDSKILVTEVAFVAQPAVQIVAGQVLVQPAGAGTPATSLTRLGAAWLPVRRRLKVDARFLAERTSNRAAGISTRGRSRLRVLWPTGRWAATLFGTVEAIATNAGLAEGRTQLGVVESIGRWSVEAYWLQRRLRDRPVSNGAGMTLLCRVGS